MTVDTAHTPDARAPEAQAPEAVPPETPFWKRTPLEAMSAAEWESLCDGCGRCCLVKLQDEDTEAIAYTDIGCQLLDDFGCHCRDYPNRQAQVPDCVRLTPDVVRTLEWLPPSCGYRLIAEGRDLYWWHHLVSGDRDTVHAAGVSVRGRVAALEDDLPLEDFVDHMVRWPLRLPKGAASRQRKGVSEPAGKEAASRRGKGEAGRRRSA
ncbi:YcgN family cysteine cluster protein [Ancylobacter sp. Lp-2]|uniref:YcgN family cysteine cluster protein n=1 Tax=Ancylobacter sp. Lp-2 TaxID=2881339 RepID=UPI00210644FC|nr:YcgN family cysteine cluster protein [Ancylobacter sp. Lp-2]MCB4768944.1 YcgN family cysteine cluster protein [Ancylobacter sp. Lp-2]